MIKDHFFKSVCAVTVFWMSLFMVGSAFCADTDILPGADEVVTSAASSAKQGGIIPALSIGIGDGEDSGQNVSVPVQVLVLMTILSLAPTILIMFTSFTRIVVVLSFLRQALGTQQVPSNQILVSLALFLTFFIMAPVWGKVKETAYQPYVDNQISQTVALDTASTHIKRFMLNQTREKDISLFLKLSRSEMPSEPLALPLTVVTPAFLISELKTAFQIGFMIYIPFIVLDMVVASVLMSMGMMMLPPVLISLPFKLMLFVISDGWYLLIGSFLKSFNM